MTNGMDENKFTYQQIESQISSELLEKVLLLYAAIFEDHKPDFFKQRIKEKEDVLILLVYDAKKLIGFKVGYRYNNTTFYSWVGGVLPTYRKNGIAQKLIHLQHQWATEHQYQKIRTKSMNRFKPMLILNLKNGFDIVQVYTNDSQQTKIIFEKKL